MKVILIVSLTKDWPNMEAWKRWERPKIQIILSFGHSPARHLEIESRKVKHDRSLPQETQRSKRDPHAGSAVFKKKTTREGVERKNRRSHRMSKWWVDRHKISRRESKAFYKAQLTTSYVFYILKQDVFVAGGWGGPKFEGKAPIVDVCGERV